MTRIKILFSAKNAFSYLYVHKIYKHTFTFPPVHKKVSEVARKKCHADSALDSQSEKVRVRKAAFVDQICR